LPGRYIQSAFATPGQGLRARVTAGGGLGAHVKPDRPAYRSKHDTLRRTAVARLSPRRSNRLESSDRLTRLSWYAAELALMRTNADTSASPLSAGNAAERASQLKPSGRTPPRPVIHPAVTRSTAGIPRSAPRGAVGSGRKGGSVPDQGRSCNARRRAGESRRRTDGGAACPAGGGLPPGTGDAGQAAPLGGRRSLPPVR
jgi:hypothetical protein